MDTLSSVTPPRSPPPTLISPSEAPSGSFLSSTTLSALEVEWCEDAIRLDPFVVDQVGGRIDLFWERLCRVLLDETLMDTGFQLQMEYTYD